MLDPHGCVTENHTDPGGLTVEQHGPFRVVLRQRDRRIVRDDFPDGDRLEVLIGSEPCLALVLWR